VIEMIREQFGATVILAFGGVLVGAIVGVSMGALAVLAHWRVIRALALFVTSLSLSSPVYWTGTLAIYLFSVNLRILPSTGTGEFRHLILPCSVLGLSLAGSIARVTMATLEATRQADFIRTARSKGLRERTIIMQHNLRASLGPIVAIIALQTGFLLGGVVVTEALFVRQGIGRVLLDAITGKDYPVVQGLVMLSAIIYSLTNTAADLIAAALDPRIQLGTSDR
jgi:peptide/nickel transport system permease protein